MSTPVLHLLAGPNGAGKSTLVERVLAPVTHLPFINADVIAAERWPDSAESHAYQASALAAAAREEMLDAGRSFITETVFSHSSKVSLVARARSLGYLTQLHVIVVPVNLSVERVRLRVLQGGHSVPEEKIRARHDRLWSFIMSAVPACDRATFYDNSSAAAPFRVVADYERGRLLGSPEWPTWTPDALTASFSGAGTS